MDAGHSPGPARRLKPLPLLYCQLSVPGVTVFDMEVTDADVAAIPARNVRVPRAEFVAVWRAASDRDHYDAARGGEGWYAAGVATTCRWLATAPSRLANGLTDSTPAPATRRTAMAHEELIEAEWLAAARLEETRPHLARSRPGWCEEKLGAVYAGKIEGAVDHPTLWRLAKAT